MAGISIVQRTMSDAFCDGSFAAAKLRPFALTRKSGAKCTSRADKYGINRCGFSIELRSMSDAFSLRENAHGRTL